MRQTGGFSSAAVVFLSLLLLAPPATGRSPEPRVEIAATAERSAAPTPSAPGTLVLYDQTDSAGTNSITSQNFQTAADAFDNQAADDFAIPAGQSWTIDRVQVVGVYFNGTGPAESVNVFFYQNAGTLPGPEVASRLNVIPVSGGDTGSFVLNILPVTLPAGHHWVSVQANLDVSVGGQWGWTERAVQSFNPSAWRNPQNGFGTGCADYQRRTSCGVGSQPDLLFRLVGDMFTCAGLPATLAGTAGADVLVGTPGDDVIVGLGGDDQVQGLGGNDVICSGEGNDTALGGSGADRLFGEAGNDRQKGQGGNDRVFGGTENDILTGGSSNDRLKGQQGNDRLKGQSGNDRHSGGPGRDRCNGGPGTDKGNCEVEKAIP